MGQIVVISIGGSLFQNLSANAIARVLPDLSATAISQLTTGVHSDAFRALATEAQAQVVEAVTVAIRDVFIWILALDAPALIGACFLSVSSRPFLFSISRRLDVLIC